MRVDYSLPPAYVSPLAVLSMSRQVVFSRSGAPPPNCKSDSRVIEIGKKAAREAGAVRPTLDWHGNEQVIIIDPATKTIDFADRPATFPGKRDKPAWWERIREYDLGPGIQLWREMGGNASGYFHTNFQIKDATKTLHDAERTRILIMRVGKNKETLRLEITLESVAELIDFEAREPILIDLFLIDPAKGTVRWMSQPANFFLVPNAGVQTALSGLLYGLTLIQSEPRSLLSYELNGARFKGVSYIARLDPAGWLVPIALPLSSSDLKTMTAFITLEAAAKESGEQVPIDPNAGFEPLPAPRMQEVLGIDGEANLWDLIRADGGGLSDAKLSRRVGLETHYDIDELREIIKRRDEKTAASIAEGYVVSKEHDMFTALGFKDRNDAYLRLQTAMGLSSSREISETLLRGDYVRRIPGSTSNLWHFVRLSDLLNGTVPFVPPPSPTKEDEEYTPEEGKEAEEEMDYASAELAARQADDAQIVRSTRDRITQILEYISREAGGDEFLLAAVSFVDHQFYRLQSHLTVVTSELAQIYSSGNASSPAVEKITEQYATETGAGTIHDAVATECSHAIDTTTANLLRAQGWAEVEIAELDPAEAAEIIEQVPIEGTDAFNDWIKIIPAEPQPPPTRGLASSRTAAKDAAKKAGFRANMIAIKGNRPNATWETKIEVVRALERRGNQPT
jgi:hypothetical protein